MRKRPANVVQTLEQCLLAKLINLKAQDAPIGRCHSLNCQIHTQSIAFTGLRFSYQFSHSCFVKGDWQDAIIKAVVVEDVGEARSNEAAETILAKSPGSMFAR